jgi:protein-tyrosine phosphatase
MIFADIHNHSLASVDDGACSEEMMYQMVDAAYADGIRILCLTPHFHPIYFGDNREATLESFHKLQDYTARRYPQLQLYLGNELRHSPNCDSWLREGFCRSLGETRLVLVDFPAETGPHLIIKGLSQLLSMGYKPILAHAERYSNLSLHTIRDLYRDGIRIQINAGSLSGSFGWSVRLRARQLLRQRLVHLVASDAHDLKHRPPHLSTGYQITVKLTEKDYADQIFYRNAVDLLENNQEGLVKEDE